MDKRVLYYAGRRAMSAEFFRAAEASPTCQIRRGPEGPVVTRGDARFHFVVRHDVAGALDALHAGFFNLVLIDLRDSRNGRRADDETFQRGLTLLDAMDQEPDIERRYGFHRILVLVWGPDTPTVDNRIAMLGVHGVGRVMRDLSTCHLSSTCAHLPSRSDFVDQVLRRMSELISSRAVGKLALCGSGGGITGLYFELGALKCLEDCCTPGALNAMDLYFGISAGGVVTGMLANGYTVREFMAAIAGVEGGRLGTIDLDLLDTAHLDFGGLSMPIRQLLSVTGHAALKLVRGQLPFSLESLVFEYGDLLHAPFRTDGFEALLERAFTQPGCTNDFRHLRRPLFIGATDQDRKQHVLFGHPPYDATPISRAIQASMSLNPVFAPTLIDGRYYEDGAVTRTSNFAEAIARGADLIFSLDPLVPYVSKEPGFARSRGVFYNADQDIRTVLFTRYETMRGLVLRRHPHVSMYTFLPANHLRQLMSVNPMDHRPYLEIWRGAYLGTLRRIETVSYRLRGDLAMHGIAFDTAPARAVAERLVSAHRLSFSSFFPDGRVDLSVPDAGRLRPPATALTPAAR